MLTLYHLLEMEEMRVNNIKNVEIWLEISGNFLGSAEIYNDSLAKSVITLVQRDITPHHQSQHRHSIKTVRGISTTKTSTSSSLITKTTLFIMSKGRSVKVRNVQKYIENVEIYFEMWRNLVQILKFCQQDLDIFRVKDPSALS